MPARRRLGLQRSRYSSYGMRPRRFSPYSGGGTVPGTSRVRVSTGVRDYPLWAPQLTTKQEMKYKDVDGANYAADTTGTITCINVIGEGDGIDTREGHRIRMLGTLIKGVVSAGSAGTVAIATLLIVQDKMPQPQGAAVVPAITDILEAVNPTAFVNVVGRDRFVILGRYDYSMTGNTTTPATGKEFYTINEKLDFNIPASWGSGAASVGAATSGLLYAVTLGSAAPSATVAPFFSVTYRSLFADV